MAANLVRAGHDLIGVTRSPSARRRLEQLGGRPVDTLADLAREANIAITMLPDSPDVVEVALGADGLLARLRPGSLYIDCSTISPDIAREIGRVAGEAGVDAVDAPVSGGESGAQKGTLSVMVGGSAPAFKRAYPVFTALATTIEHVGPNGAGQTVKAANQLLVGGQLLLVAEVLNLLQSTSIDIQAALTVLGNGLAASRVLESKAPAMLSGAFEPGFRIELHHKDLAILLEIARGGGIALPLAGVVEEAFRSAVRDGLGELDHSAVIVPVRAARPETAR